jgi:hypothetical protein
VADLEADIEETEVSEDEEEWEDDGIAEVIEVTRRDSIPSARAGNSRNAVASDEPEGLRTPRAMKPVRHSEEGGEGDGSPSEDELTELASTLSLTETATPRDFPDHPPASVGLGASAAPRNRPMDIPTSGPAMGRYELTPEALGTENVMTPRNDIGPFVLDGGAGRSTSTSANLGARRGQGAGGVGSLDAAAAGEVEVGPA